ncbi:MAG TPA: cbb3-type cytochrome oxidase assembly protein CcoS [Deltaproteobacteria bacterium]|nr:cbb3-type cytochrome oxidase assembly protein CcoS [Deltaproteobacteria bacterium]
MALTRLGAAVGAAMSFLGITIPATLLLSSVLVLLVVRAVRRGEFDDMEGPAQRHVFDDDRCPERPDDL